MIGLIGIFHTGRSADIPQFKLIEQFKLLFSTLWLQVKVDGFVVDLAIDTAASSQLQTALTTLHSEGLVQANAQAIICLPVR